MPYQNLLAAVELESSCVELLRYANKFARRCDAQLTVATAIPDMSTLYHGTERTMQLSFDRSVVAAARERLESLCRQAGVTVAKSNLVIARGDPDTTLAELAATRDIDLILFGNHDRHGLDQYIGGFAMGLLHRARCDLYAVLPEPEFRGLDRPLVALANDEHDGKLAERAREFTDKGLNAVHVIRPHVFEYLQSREDREALRKSETARLVEQLTTRLHPSAPLQLDVRFDTPSKGIEAAAREADHQLIVMGCGEHTELGWRLGSTAHNLLSRTDSNVLLVRPD